MENHKVVEAEDLIWANCNFYFNWSLPNFGFGQMQVTYDKDTKQFYIDNECLRRERVREVLIGLANHIADVAILDCVSIHDIEEEK